MHVIEINYYMYFVQFCKVHVCMHNPWIIIFFRTMYLGNAEYSVQA